jgi:hypothetical protein
VLQQLDYLAYIDIYHERIKMFHVKDAEFNPTGKQGVYSRLPELGEPRGRFRSLGDGQVDFGGIFSKLAAYDYEGWAVLEWECCAEAPRGRRARRPNSSAPHHPRDAARLRRFRRSGTDEAATAILGISKEATMAENVAAGRSASAWSAAAPGAFIGGVHRIAARLDGDYELVAGALSSRPGSRKSSRLRATSGSTLSAPTL